MIKTTLNYLGDFYEDCSSDDGRLEDIEETLEQVNMHLKEVGVDLCFSVKLLTADTNEAVDKVHGYLTVKSTNMGKNNG